MRTWGSCHTMDEGGARLEAEDSLEHPLVLLSQ